MRTEIVITIFVMAAATFLTRAISPLLLGSIGIPAWLTRFLKHVPTAMLTALIAPALIAPRGYIQLSMGNDYLLAGLVAIVAASFRQPPLVTMGAGMGVMLLLRV